MVTRGCQVGVYKPAASGIRPGVAGDAEQLWRSAELTSHIPLERVCPQQYSAPLAPPAAAQAEGRTVDEDQLIEGAIWWHGRCDFLVIEGIGGVLSPISATLTNLDLLERLQPQLGSMPSLIVAANRLGVVNHTLLTLEALQRRQLPILGVFLNQLPHTVAPDAPSLASNASLIRQFAPNYPLWTEVDSIAVQLEVTLRDNSVTGRATEN